MHLKETKICLCPQYASDIKIILCWRQLRSSKCCKSSLFSAWRQEIHSPFIEERFLSSQRGISKKNLVKVTLNFFSYFFTIPIPSPKFFVLSILHKCIFLSKRHKNFLLWTLWVFIVLSRLPCTVHVKTQ